MVVTRGGKRLPEVIGRDGQLAVSAVNEHGKLDAGGAAVVDEFGERGADGAPGEKDIVKEDDVRAFDRERKVGPADGREVPRLSRSSR